MAQLRRGGAIAQGESMRYLDEAAWYPTALLPSQVVQWEALDDRAAKATLTDGEITATLTFRFHSGGLTESVRSEARGRAVNDAIVMTPWKGRWSNYQERSGMRVPLPARWPCSCPRGDCPTGAELFHRWLATSRHRPWVHQLAHRANDPLLARLVSTVALHAGSRLRSSWPAGRCGAARRRHGHLCDSARAIPQRGRPPPRCSRRASAAILAMLQKTLSDAEILAFLPRPSCWSNAAHRCRLLSSSCARGGRLGLGRGHCSVDRQDRDVRTLPHTTR